MRTPVDYVTEVLDASKKEGGKAGSAYTGTAPAIPCEATALGIDCGLTLGSGRQYDDTLNTLKLGS